MLLQPFVPSPIASLRSFSLFQCLLIVEIIRPKQFHLGMSNKSKTYLFTFSLNYQVRDIVVDQRKEIIDLSVILYFSISSIDCLHHRL